MKLKTIINSRYNEFIALCQSYDVKCLYAFGSSISNQFNEDTSDIDLLIEIDIKDPIERGDMLMKVWDQLEFFFQRKVDLLTFNSIKNPILKEEIDLSKVLIYDKAKQKIFPYSLIMVVSPFASNLIMREGLAGVLSSCRC